jgi:hypothetical protein
MACEADTVRRGKSGECARRKMKSAGGCSLNDQKSGNGAVYGRIDEAVR